MRVVSEKIISSEVKREFPDVDGDGENEQLVEDKVGVCKVPDLTQPDCKPKGLINFFTDTGKAIFYRFLISPKCAVIDRSRVILTSGKPLNKISFKNHRGYKVKVGQRVSVFRIPDGCFFGHGKIRKFLDPHIATLPTAQGKKKRVGIIAVIKLENGKTIEMSHEELHPPFK